MPLSNRAKIFSAVAATIDLSEVSRVRRRRPPTTTTGICQWSLLSAWRINITSEAARPPTLGAAQCTVNSLSQHRSAERARVTDNGEWCIWKENHSNCPVRRIRDYELRSTSARVDCTCGRSFQIRASSTTHANYAMHRKMALSSINRRRVWSAPSVLSLCVKVKWARNLLGGSWKLTTRWTTLIWFHSSVTSAMRVRGNTSSEEWTAHTSMELRNCLAELVIDLPSLWYSRFRSWVMLRKVPHLLAAIIITDMPHAQRPQNVLFVSRHPHVILHVCGDASRPTRTVVTKLDGHFRTQIIIISLNKSSISAQGL